MDPTLDQLLAEVSEFERQCRPPGAVPLEVSALYDLYPGEPMSHPHRIIGGWPESWPNTGRAGVYVIICRDLTVAYIGKAEMGNTVGRRLDTYFRSGQPCVAVKSGWTRPLRYVMTIAVPDPRSGEAPALEQHLLNTVGSWDNTTHNP